MSDTKTRLTDLFAQHYLYSLKEYPAQQKRRPIPQQDIELSEEDEEEPIDRLTVLLQDSKFTCFDKKDGYYADEGLNCEIFHYCMDKVKHSWLCPEGAAFHQVS